MCYLTKVCHYANNRLADSSEFEINKAKTKNDAVLESNNFQG